MAISSPGIGSGLDVNSIVSKLMAVEQQPLTDLSTKEASYQAKLSAYGTLQGALASFQSAMQGLNSADKFQTVVAGTSDATIATATASSSAIPGAYSINVSKVAQAQKLVATGQNSTSSTIGTGVSTTLTFDFGTISGGTLTAYNSIAGTGGTYSGASLSSNGNGTKTVTIDSSNNTLAGIRDAINAANIGVSATIVNDGSGSPYRLSLSSVNSGQSNSMKISVAGDASISTLLTQNPAGTQNMQETLASQNTEMTVNGLFVSQSGNTLTDVIAGTTVTPLKVGTATITVSRDTTSATTAVNAFVKGYNDLAKSIKDLTFYDASTKKAGTLQGQSSVLSIQRQIRDLLTHSIVGSGSNTNLAYTNLSQVGITLQKDGTLSLDSSKFQSALNSNPVDVAALFSVTSKTSDSLVSYVSSTSATKPGTYAINVTQAATQGKLIGSTAAGLTITTGSNDVLNVTIDGVGNTVTLAAGSYTAASLAIEVQSKINGLSSYSAASPKISVAVSQTAGVMTISSDRYGSASKVAVSGSGATSLLGGVPVTTNGVDIAGSIDGVTGTGSGQTLTGATGSNADGLKLLITGSATRYRGTVSPSQGYIYQLDSLMTTLLGSNGTVSSATDGVNKIITDIGRQRDKLNLRLAVIEKQYRTQFTALDVLMGRLQSTQSYLTQQLATISNQTKLN